MRGGRAGLDLNLLRVLDALVRERSAARAAKCLGVTPSAVSHALGRLRAHFGDPLFVRDGTRMTPTPRALEIEEPIRSALDLLGNAAKRPAAFDPRRARRVFFIGTSDLVQTLLLPPLAGVLAAEAPNVRVVVRPPAGDPGAALQEQGGPDLLVMPTLFARPGLVTQRLFEDPIVCVLREGHPAARRGGLDVETYLDLKHVVAVPHGAPGDLVDAALARIRKTRDVAIETPHFLAAMCAAATSDLAMSVPRRVAQAFADMLRLVVLPLPVKVAPLVFHAYWHERSQNDAAHAWFREAVRRSVRPPLAASASRSKDGRRSVG
jgi:DNA-binding transcriptional LysR family regulator